MNEEFPSDRDLLDRVRDGDREAFATLYRRRQAGIYRFALQMSGSEALAEDVVQEVFLTLIRGGAAYDPARGEVASFLYGIARNHVRRGLAHRRAGDAETASDQAASGHPESDLARSELIAAVRAAVLALPVRYREAVVLCDLEEIDQARAAEALGCAVGTVKSRLHRARRMLMERLHPARRAQEIPSGVKPAGCAP
jgi:RNA polymerase sigma-70 factor (ECF subfamily)